MFHRFPVCKSEASPLPPFSQGAPLSNRFCQEFHARPSLQVYQKFPQGQDRRILHGTMAAALGAPILVVLLDLGLLAGLTGLSCWLACIAAGLAVNSGNLAAAFFSLWVVCALAAAVGFGLSAWQPGPAAGILAGLVIISYLVDLLGPVLKLPDWLVSLSIFRQYGKPVVNGPNWPTLLVMLALSVVIWAAAAYRFDKRDIVK